MSESIRLHARVIWAGDTSVIWRVWWLGEGVAGIQSIGGDDARRVPLSELRPAPVEASDDAASVEA
jgi:hypothetical protein